jgi:eukaryotic-like serine/threonine-protein kinase
VSLSSGTPLGPYRITAALGAGGMGEVYKARDTRLDRTVAIKVLPSSLTTDPAARERFDREARSIAALSHPHICPLFDVGDENGTEFLVMEFLDGETLAEVLTRGRLPRNRALMYADQIADALEAAHKAGIIHRDLKPSNIMITKAGAKLLDFGLAKPRQPGAFAGSTETITDRGLTRAGTIVGTLQYMAPEQLEGLEADARSDIFAFGTVLYEMLTGHGPHRAKTAAGIVAAIMREPAPSPRHEIPDVPALVDTAIRKCLEKDPGRRWQSMEAVRDVLKWADEMKIPATADQPVSGRWRTVATVALGLALVSGTWMVSRVLTAPVVHAPLVRSDIDVPRAMNLGFDSTFALSPDGRWLAIATGRGLWLRSLEDSTLRHLPGTAGAYLPFWSPDNKAIAFFAEGKLKRLDLPEGAPEILADAPNARGGAWSSVGVIVFAPTALGPLVRVAARGGDISPVTALEDARQEDSHRSPFFLANGRRFTYFAQSRQSSRNAVRIGSLDPPAAAGPLVIDAGIESGAAYVNSVDRQPGYLIYVRNRDLVAQRFDDESGTVSGEPTVLSGGARSADPGGGLFSVANTGAIVYVMLAPRRHQPRWIGRTGQPLGLAGEPGSYDTIALSPDRRKLVAGRAADDAGTIGLWVFDFERNLNSRVPLGGRASSAVWAPDGEHMAVAWAKSEEHPNVYVVDLSASEEPRSVLPGGAIRWPLDWSRDGAFLLFAQVEPASRFDIWAIRMTGADRTAIPVVRGPGKDNEARFSPDGRFIAYQSDDSGESRVYVMRFQPERGPRVLVSDGEAGEPRWREDGRELYYISKERALMAVPLDIRPNELVPGRPVRLFGGRAGEEVWHFEPDARGERFLVLPLSEEPDSTPLHLITGWQGRVR